MQPPMKGQPVECARVVPAYRSGCFGLAAAATAATAATAAVAVVVEVPNHNGCFVLVLVLAPDLVGGMARDGCTPWLPVGR